MHVQRYPTICSSFMSRSLAFSEGKLSFFMYNSLNNENMCSYFIFLYFFKDACLVIGCCFGVVELIYNFMQEGFAFSHCTTCKAQFHLRVESFEDNSWRKLKFRLFVARDVLLVFLAVQTVSLTFVFLLLRGNGGLYAIKRYNDSIYMCGVCRLTFNLYKW